MKSRAGEKNKMSGWYSDGESDKKTTLQKKKARKKE